MFFKNHVLLISFFIFIASCQLKDPLKPHGIMYLENRSNELYVKKSNKNDVIKIFGRPHIKDKDKYETWIYFERILTKGEFLKLGQNVLKENNILILNFDKYGVLKSKKFLNKNDKEDIKFSQKITKNEITQKSFVEKFLYSLKTKMYGNKK